MKSPECGGPEGDRSLDLTDANRTLSQLSYRPKSTVPKAEQKNKQYEIIDVAENRTLCAPS